MSRRSLGHIVPICVALTCVVAGCMSGRARQIYVLSDPVDTPPDNKAVAGHTELQLEPVRGPAGRQLR